VLGVVCFDCCVDCLGYLFWVGYGCGEEYVVLIVWLG